MPKESYLLCFQVFFILSFLSQIFTTNATHLLISLLTLKPLHKCASESGFEKSDLLFEFYSDSCLVFTIITQKRLLSNTTMECYTCYMFQFRNMQHIVVQHYSVVCYTNVLTCSVNVSLLLKSLAFCWHGFFFFSHAIW